MKFAIVDNVRREAEPGIKGRCPVCNAECIAKCGQFKINHWAHKSKHNCDNWWESETPWHRKWKDKFPKEWQEVIDYDLETGEKHIADVRTDTGLVIEFQHSAIKPEEQERNFIKQCYGLLMAQDVQAGGNDLLVKHGMATEF